MFIHKNFIFNIFRLLGCIIGILISAETIKKIKRVINLIYSGIISNSFKKVGANFYVEYPLNIHNAKNIQIGDNFSSFSRLRLETYSEHNGAPFKPQILIKNNVSINFDCHIALINKIIIGNNVLIASKVFISDHSHGHTDKESFKIPPSLRILYSKGPVIIEDNVWIGEGAVILPNVTIGKGSIVGANSVVTKSFPPYSVIAGVPSVLIKKSMK